MKPEKVMEKTKVDITVRNQQYSVITTDDPEKLKKYAADIDEKINEIMLNTKISLNQALVLVALELSEEVNNQQAVADHYKNQIGDYLQDAERAMIERDKYKRELEKLKKLKTN